MGDEQEFGQRGCGTVARRLCPVVDLWTCAFLKGPNNQDEEGEIDIAQANITPGPLVLPIWPQAVWVKRIQAADVAREALDHRASVPDASQPDVILDCQDEGGYGQQLQPFARV